MTTRYLHSNFGFDGNVWYAAKTGGSPVEVQSGDTLDLCGYTLYFTATTGNIGILADLTLINSGTSGGLFVFSTYGDDNYANINVGSNATVQFDGGSNRGSVIVKAGGTCLIAYLDNGDGTNYGNIIVETGGTCTMYDISNLGNIIVNGICQLIGDVSTSSVIVGREGVFTTDTNSGIVTVESGGSCDIGINQGYLAIESGGDLTVQSSGGVIIEYLYSSVTGATNPILLNTEKYTLHYTAGQSTDTYPDKITADTEVLYGKPGDYMDECIGSNILSGKSIAEIPGSGGRYAF